MLVSASDNVMIDMKLTGVENVLDGSCAGFKGS